MPFIFCATFSSPDQIHNRAACVLDQRGRKLQAPERCERWGRMGAKALNLFEVVTTAALFMDWTYQFHEAGPPIGRKFAATDTNRN